MKTEKKPTKWATTADGKWYCPCCFAKGIKTFVPLHINARCADVAIEGEDEPICGILCGPCLKEYASGQQASAS